jgi:RNA polymerase sigma-70 factor (ECF subfamily)
MQDRAGPDTRVTLLARLRDQPGDQAAWAEFVADYGPVIRAWCRRWQLQEADAEDVTQNVLLRLAAKLPEFVYDRSKSFRAWLTTLTHHAWHDFLHRYVSPTPAAGGSSVRERLESVPAREDLQARLEAAFDAELLAIASARVRERVAPQTWEAFRLTAVEGLSGAEAAERIPMQVAQVYVAKRRVQQMLQEELARLDSVAEGGAGR